jgi:hypothetical protein
MLAVELNGGLGNQLFQLAAAETIAKETNRKMCLLGTVSPSTVHSTANYFDSVFAEWKSLPVLPTPYAAVTEPSYKKQDWTPLRPSDESVCLRGYFQNWKYIPPNFTSRLKLPYVPRQRGAFLHIRGGDFVNNDFHNVNILQRYYRSAINYFPRGTHFFIYTNDVSYAKGCEFLSTIRHTFVEADELTSLAGMAMCTQGGICANSSFSWWGAFLNPNRTIVMPTRFFSDPTVHIEGYYFPDVIRCAV